MQTNSYEHEIDLLDLFNDWIHHWKSLLAVLLAALVVGGGMMVMTGGSSDGANGNASELSQEEIEAFFDSALSNDEATQMEDLADVYKVYANSYEKYLASKDSMSVADSAAASYNLSLSYDTIMTALSDSKITTCQKAYFSYLIGENLDLTDVINEAKDAGTATEAALKSIGADSGFTFTKKHLILVVFAAIVLHAMVICLIYVFNGKVKRTDSIGAMLKVDEIGRFVSTDINAAALTDIVQKKALSSIGIVSVGSADQAKALSEACTDITTTVVTSLPESAAEMETLCNLKAAVILITIGLTKHKDLIQMADTLRMHQVDVLGVIVD